MEVIRFGIISAGILMVCWAGKKIGDPCKGTGVCAAEGTCAPDTKMGKCCGGLDCCNMQCYEEGDQCKNGQGRCVSDCLGEGQTLEGGNCCDGLVCCSQTCLSGNETCPYQGGPFECRAAECENGGKIPYYGGCCNEAGGSGNPKYCCENPPKP